jgi:Na+/melibiose symporter-like transporter
MATVLPGLLLAFVGFPQNATPATLDPAIMHRLCLIYVPLAATLSAIAIGVWRFYRIDEDAHERNLATIDAQIDGVAHGGAAAPVEGLAPSEAPTPSALRA